MDYNSWKYSKTEWNVYFSWYFEPSQNYQESQVAFLKNKILRLTKADK